MAKENVLKSLNLSDLKVSFSDELGKLNNWDDLNVSGKIKQLLKVIDLAETEIEKNGSAAAFTWYGNNLVSGGCEFPINIDKGIELLQCAMGMGEYEALTSLANIYSGSFAHIQDDKYNDMTKALHYYKKASDLNDGYASYRVALCYYEGMGTKKDISKAIEYAEIAKRQGGEYGNLLWGTWLLEGLILNEDQDEAYELFYSAYEYLKSENDASPEWLVSMVRYKLGYCMFYGFGTEQNKEDGFAYMSESASQGDIEAIHWMKEYQDHINICGKFF